MSNKPQFLSWPVIRQVTRVLSPCGCSTNVVTFFALKGLRNSRSTTISPSATRVISMLPAPALRLPFHA